MSIIKTITTTDGYRVSATPHAQEKFYKRVGPTATAWLGADLRELFVAGVPVGLVRKSGRARLHPPSGALLIYTDHPTRSREYLVRTVLRAEFTELNDDHLVTCSDCELRYDRGMTSDCPWCERGISQ